jgi:hypothetical protein
VCISFGNPSEPCCGDQVPPGWILTYAYPYGFVQGLEPRFAVYGSGNTSHRATKVRDWSFQLERLKAINGTKRLKLISHIPNIPSDTLYGTGSIEGKRYWSDIARLPPLVLLDRTGTGGVRYSFFTDGPPDEFGITDAIVGTSEFGGVNPDWTYQFASYRDRRFRVVFNGASALVSSSPDVQAIVSPPTRTESFARRLTGVHLAILCRGTYSDSSGSFHCLVPFSVRYDVTTERWVQGLGTDDSLAAGSWFNHVATTHISETRFTVHWDVGADENVSAEVYVTSL